MVLRRNGMLMIRNTGEINAGPSVISAPNETVDLPFKNRAMLANALGKITLTVKPQNDQATCKLRVEKEKEITNAGSPVTCSYEITEDTDN